MSGMTTMQTRRKHTGEPGNGGLFAGTDHDDATINLTATATDYEAKAATYPTGTNGADPDYWRRIDEAHAFVNAPAPAGLSEAQRKVYEAASANFLDDRQPLSYMAFLASQNAKFSSIQRDRIESATAERGTADHVYWSARADRFNEIADKLYELSGASRYPIRNPDNIAVDDRTGTDVMDDIIDNWQLEDRRPVGVTETRAALKNSRGEANGFVRHVRLDWKSVPPTSDAHLDVVGPRDGRPIIVSVQAGCPNLTVTSGHAIIIADGNGFGIKVADGARATVIGKPDGKVSITAEHGSTVDFYVDAETRGYQSIREGADFTLHGRADRVTLSTDSR